MTRRARAGFTVVELIVASALSMLIVAVVIFMFTTQRRAYWRERQTNEMKQNMRTAMDMIIRDVRMAGYGMPMPAAGFLPRWFNWVPGVTNRLCIIRGATTNDPDQIMVVGAFDEPVCTTASATSPGATTLCVTPDPAGSLDANVRKVIFIGRTEVARILSVASGQLTISAHPTLSSRGLRYAYPAGTQIELVEAVTYSCRPSPTGFPYRPYLIRDNHTGAVTNTLQVMAAVGIEDLRASVSSDTVSLTITGRTAEQDPRYTHPTKRDRYHRSVAAGIIRLRNPD